MNPTRRSLLAALGWTLPLGLGARAGAVPAPAAPTLRFRPFEDAVRAAFAAGSSIGDSRRVEVGPCDAVRAGVQGMHNDRPFAGFPAGHLRIVRTGSEAGPDRDGVRLYVTTLEVARTGGLAPGDAGRPLDFATLPPAPTLA